MSSLTHDVNDAKIQMSCTFDVMLLSRDNIRVVLMRHFFFGSKDKKSLEKLNIE